MQALPDEIIREIFAFIPFYTRGMFGAKKYNWLHLLVICKRFNRIAKGAFNIASIRRSPFIESCSRGKVQSVLSLITDYKVDLSTDGTPGLELATLHGHTEVVQMLLTYPQVKVRPETVIQTLQSAVQSDRFSTMECVLCNYAIPKDEYARIFTRAIQLWTHPSTISLLLQHPNGLSKNEMLCIAGREVNRGNPSHALIMLLKDKEVAALPATWEIYSSIRNTQPTLKKALLKCSFVREQLRAPR